MSIRKWKNKQLISTGLESVVYKITQNNGEEFILKSRKLGGKQNYLFEAYCLEQLASIGAMVPSVINYSSDHISISIINGSEIDDQRDIYNNKTVFLDIANNLALCQNKAFTGFGAPINRNGDFIGEHDSWKDYLASILTLFDTTETETSGLSAQQIAKIKKYYESNYSDISLDTGTIVHGDFAMNAIFVDNKKFSGIIDFGDGLIGDPMLDLAYFRFKDINKDYGNNIYQNLINNYFNQPKIKKPKDFESRINLYMIYWGIQRINHCPDDNIRRKFGDKLKIVSDIL